MILGFNIMDNVMPVIVLVAVVTIAFLYIRKDHNAENKEHLKNLEDEYLYDPETGEKFTLEEVESKGFPPSNPNRIKTEEEIERYFIERGYKVLESESEEEVSRFENISWWESYEGVYADTIFKINEKSYLYFVQVTYSSIGFKGRRDSVSEIQLMLWLRNPLSGSLEYLKSIKDIDYIQNGNDYFFKLSKIANLEGVKQLLNQE